jgi:membrane protease subunit HflK
MADPIITPGTPPKPAAPPETPGDTGSQALSEALRSSFVIVKIVMALLVAVFLCSGFFQVHSQEQAIILRLGKPVGQGSDALLGPGLHWSWPYPIDEYVKVSINGLQQVRSSVGWFYTTPEMELAGNEPFAGPTLNPAVDGYALTADNNIIHTRVTMQYRIRDPIRYIFSFVNASNAVQNALDNALLDTVAHYKVDDILTRDVIGFNEAVRRRVSELVEQQNLGIVVEQCVPQSIPPRQLKDAFANVLKAEVTRSKVLNDARSYENQVLSKASADAESRVNLAQSDRNRLVTEMKSQAERFKDLLPQYQANPALFKQQRLIETMGRVMTNLQDKIYLSESADGRQKQLRLLLNREPPKVKSD